MINKRSLVKVPASTANLGPGFDTLGMALDLYLWVELRSAETTSIHYYGPEAQSKGLPVDKTNLIYKVAQMVFAEAGVSVPELEVSQYSDIPLTRGLGSSASAIVGGMAAANALIGSPLSDHRLFQLATRLEKHPDNVGASLFGGIIAATWDGEEARHLRIDPDDRLEVLVAIPEFQLSTEKARGILPSQYSRSDAVYNVSHSSLLVAALCSGRLDMIRHAMKDRIHQPYRASLVPGMDKILKEATDYGALGIALSGAGPTLLALVDGSSGRKDELENFLIETLRKEGIGASTLWLKPSAMGVQVLTPVSEHSTFIENVKGDTGA